MNPSLEVALCGGGGGGGAAWQPYCKRINLRRKLDN